MYHRYYWLMTDRLWGYCVFDHLWSKQICVPHIVKHSTAVCLTPPSVAKYHHHHQVSIITEVTPYVFTARYRILISKQRQLHELHSGGWQVHAQSHLAQVGAGHVWSGHAWSRHERTDGGRQSQDSAHARHWLHGEMSGQQPLHMYEQRSFRQWRNQSATARTNT